MNNNEKDLEVCSNILKTNDEVNGIIKNIEVIEERMFEDEINITDVVIGQNIKEIKAKAFSNCQSLKDVWFYMEPGNRYKSVVIDETAFDGCDNVCFHMPGVNSSWGGNACIEDFARRHKIQMKNAL